MESKNKEVINARQKKLATNRQFVATRKTLDFLKVHFTIGSGSFIYT